MASPVTEELLAALSQLGFSQYEARAYCALLAGPPMNGHEVAKASGVPPSKIYETLNRLAEKGAVLVQRQEPVTYMASSREAVMESARQKFQRAFEAADTALSQIKTPPDSGRIWMLRERDTVIAALGQKIASAHMRVFAALWDEELGPLRHALEEASRRGCAVHVAVYGTTQLNGPDSYDLTLCGRSAAERLDGRRLSAVVADGADTLVAEFRSDGSVEAVATSHPVISLLAVEYIKADVLGRLLINEMGESRFEQLRHGPKNVDAFLRS
jgi:sugar-specific transcriptional regulator TrmB